MRFVTTPVLAIAALLITGPARADVLAPTSYDTPNGFGQANGGQFNYWDLNYTGAGSTTTDGAPLSGGLGDLTDGVVTNQPWFSVENAAGSGPYVGWTTLDPTIVFHFTGVTAYQTIEVHVDDSDEGGVSAPASILVGDGNISQLFAVTSPPTRSGSRSTSPPWACRATSSASPSTARTSGSSATRSASTEPAPSPNHRPLR